MGEELSFSVCRRGMLHGMGHVVKILKRGVKRGATALSTSSRWVRAEESGIFRPFKGIGDHVDAGERIGVVADPYGESETDVVASLAGIVIGRANIPAVNQGDALSHIARVENAPQLGAHYDRLNQIGRAACREQVCRYV